MATSDEILRELREINRKLDRLLGKDRPREPSPVRPKRPKPWLVTGAVALPEPEEVFLTEAMQKRFERSRRK